MRCDGQRTGNPSGPFLCAGAHGAQVSDAGRSTAAASLPDEAAETRRRQCDSATVHLVCEPTRKQKADEDAAEVNDPLRVGMSG
jgi:hypothetical protein